MQFTLRRKIFLWTGNADLGLSFSLVFTQPLIGKEFLSLGSASAENRKPGNYGVPSSARDENGLLKYFESPVCTLQVVFQILVEGLLFFQPSCSAKCFL